MSVKVSYNKQTLDTPNFFARYAHTRRYYYSLELSNRELKKSAVLLDFGCGRGDFLCKLYELRPDVSLFGFDPESGHEPKNYTLINDMTEIDDLSMDLVVCFETLEHLVSDEINEFVRQVKRVLVPDGKLIISVPIIGGPVLLLKELNRMMLFKRRSDYSIMELFKASFIGKPALRPDNPRPSHKGFDFKSLEGELISEFTLIEKSFVPFNSLPWYLNSQVFYIFSSIKL